MHKKIVITETELENVTGSVRLSCLVSENRLLEVRCERLEQESGLGNIYVGRVQKVVKNIKAAFIEIAPKMVCYYPLENGRTPVYIKKIPSIDMVQGDEVLVQIQKEGVKTKAPTVTTNLTLTGRYVVLTSENKRIGFSAKLTAAEKEHFRNLLKDQTCESYGVIIRTNARNVSDEDVLRELQHLRGQLSALIQRASTRTCFSCVYQAQPKYMTYIQNSYQEDLEEIITDHPGIFAEIQAYQNQYPALAQIPLRLYEDSLQPLFKLYNLEREITHARQKKVWLKSGGYLVIEPTEALTVIDVNTGKSIARKEPQKHFLKINLEAAAEIALQLRLRNLSGIIIIDFIDLAAETDRLEVMHALRKAVQADSVPVQVLDMTKLNLVEMTRKKIEKSLAEQLT